MSVNNKPVKNISKKSTFALKEEKASSAVNFEHDVFVLVSKCFLSPFFDVSVLFL